MLLALLLTLISTSSGTLLTYIYDEDTDFATRVAQGGATGLVALGLVGLVCSTLIGLTTLSIVISASFLSLIACLLAGSRTFSKLHSRLLEGLGRLRRGLVSPSRNWICLVIAVVAMSLVLWQVFDRAMFYRDGTLYTGVEHNYGDLPFHLAAVARFVYGGNIPPEDPVFAGTRFMYPYLADFVSAMLVTSGAGFREAMLMQSLILVLSLLWLLIKWAFELTADRLAALMTPAIVLLGSGLGFTLIFKEAWNTERGLLSVMWKPLHDYSMIPDAGLHWGDSLTSLLVTQRSLLIGLPLAVIIFRIWWRFSTRNSIAGADPTSPVSELAGSAKPASVAKSDGTYVDRSIIRVEVPMLAAGVIAGFLPVCHAHTFLVVMAVATYMALTSQNWRGWVSFFVPAILLGASQAWAISRGSTVQLQSFLTLNLGWESGGQNVVWFWLKNTGVLIPLLIVAAVRREGKPLLPGPLLRYYLPFIGCLIVPNLVKLAPWTWDNMKVLFYWYLASAPLAALVLSTLWRGGHWRSVLSVLLFASLIFSGSLNVLRILTSGEAYAVFSPEQLAFAQMIKEDTPPNALILHAPTFDDPVFLTGRRSFMGYPGHIWTHGIDYGPRQKDIERIYEGGATAQELIARYKIQYAVVSPQERNLMRVDQTFFDKFAKVAVLGEYCLYRTQ